MIDDHTEWCIILSDPGSGTALGGVAIPNSQGGGRFSAVDCTGRIRPPDADAGPSRSLSKFFNTNRPSKNTRAALSAGPTIGVIVSESCHVTCQIARAAAWVASAGQPPADGPRATRGNHETPAPSISASCSGRSLSPRYRATLSQRDVDDFYGQLSPFVAGGEEPYKMRRRIVGIRKGPIWGPSDCGVQND
jgi:hypothetical protein